MLSTVCSVTDCNTAIGKRNRSGICRTCYLRQKQVAFRQSKRVVNEINEVELDEVDINIDNSTFDISKTREVARTPAKKKICRNYDEAVIAACQLDEESEKMKNMMKQMTKTVEVQPFALLFDGDVEVNALSSVENIRKILALQASSVRLQKFMPCLTGEASMDNNEDSSVDDISINYIIKTSPYNDALNGYTYEALNDEHLAISNADWLTKPVLRYAIPLMFSGAILIDRNKALLVNTVEIYCRRPTLDAHHEQQTDTSKSSIPNKASQYPFELCIRIVDTDNTKKLVVGTNTMDLLIVSNLRVDKSLCAQVGPSVTNFIPSKETKIFICNESYQQAMKMLSSTNKVQSVHETDIMSQLRQVRSKFTSNSTYTLCRASFVLVNNCMCRPHTIYTLADRGTGNDAAYKRGSKVFQEIAKSMLFRNGVLYEDDLGRTSSDDNNTKVDEIVENIRALVASQDKGLEIIKSKELNDFLVSLATELSSAIIRANEAIEKILSAFTR